VKRIALAAWTGALVAVAKVWLAFHVWLAPLLVELGNAALLVMAIIAFAIVRRAPLGAVVVGLAVALLSVPVAGWIGDRRVRDAQEYCEHPTGDPPLLLQPGYSVRYQPQVEPTQCTFPDVFPGRSFWAGERSADGKWTFEHLMD
jgi:hypothetical protein